MTFSSFTPSSMPPELLEAVFTARQELADDVFDSIRDGLKQSERRAFMLIGPRGIGKTFFVSLLHHRITTEKTLVEKVRFAWLPEDPDVVASYATLLREIVNALHIAYTFPSFSELTADVRSQVNDDERTFLLEQALIDFLSGRALFLISENFNDILIALNEREQRQLRALLQTKLENPILLCSSTSLIPQMNSREAALHGFFTFHTLYPFDFEDCVGILIRMAKASRNDALAGFLKTPKGRARVRAVHHLAGGNPRIYVIFFDFLSIDSLDSLKEPFKKLIDDLTPYYQSRMYTLSARQKQYVEIIRRNVIPMAVKDIAQEAFAPPTSTSKDLGRLVDLGYLISRKVGRESLYELREPLMRICLAIKDQHGGAVPLFVEFLRVWFIEPEMKEGGPVGNAKQWLDDKEYQSAFQDAEREHTARIHYFLKSIADESEDIALAKLEAMHSSEPGNRAIWWALKERLEARKDWPTLVERAKIMTERFPDETWSWNALDIASSYAKQYDIAFEASRRAMDLDSDSPVFVSNFVSNVGRNSNLIGKYRDNLKTLLQFIDDKLNSTKQHDKEWLVSKAQIQSALGDEESASETMMQFLAQSPNNYTQWRTLLVALQRCKAHKAFLRASEIAAKKFSENCDALIGLSIAYNDVRQSDEALQAVDRAAKLGADECLVALIKFRSYFDKGHLTAARQLLPLIFESFKKEVHGGPAITASFLQTLDGNVDRAKDTITLATDHYSKEKDLTQIGTPFRIAEVTDQTELLSDTARIWVEVFKIYPDGLATLGANLVKGILSPTLDLSQERLLRWCDIWGAVAGDLPEMAIPLRLMRATAYFRYSLDETDLMSLPMEERAMLKQPIQRYLQVLGKEKHPLDDKVSAFLEVVQECWKSDAKKKALEAVKARQKKWLEDAPPIDCLSKEQINNILKNYHARKHLPKQLDPLFEALWKGVPKKDAHSLIAELANADGDVARILGHQSVTIYRIDTTSPPFVNGQLFQIHLATPAGISALDFWSDGTSFVIIDGTSQTIHNLVKDGAVTITNETLTPYISFYCNQLRGEEGRFQTILPENEKSLKALKRVGLDIADFDDLILSEKNDEAITEKEPKQRPELTALVIYDNKPFASDFILKDRETGQVDMVDDRPISDERLSLPKEAFMGPLRAWEADNSKG